MKTQAIINLCPNASFRVEDDIVEWLSDDITQPKDAEIDAEVKRLQAQYDALQYQRDRIYPLIGDQLDEIYHNGIDEWKKTIKAVKDAHPKP